MWKKHELWSFITCGSYLICSNHNEGNLQYHWILLDNIYICILKELRIFLKQLEINKIYNKSN